MLTILDADALADLAPMDFVRLDQRVFEADGCHRVPILHSRLWVRSSATPKRPRVRRRPALPSPSDSRPLLLAFRGR